MVKKSKLLQLKNFVNNDDDETPFATLHNSSYVAWMGTNPAGAWDKIAEWKLDSIMCGHQQNPNYNANWQIPHNFLCYAMPALTGISFAYISSQNYGDYMSYIYDPQYVMNPATSKAANVKINPQTPFSGFKAIAWSCDKEVINPETLEKVPTPTNINENSILYAIISYKTKADMDKFEKPLPTSPDVPALKSRFDFAMNMDYSTKALAGNDSGEMYLCAQAANEVIFFCKVQEGIIILNWPTSEYKGTRTPVGSLKGKMTQAQDFINHLAEKEIVTWKDEPLF